MSPDSSRRVRAVIQSRLNSSRLPGKALLSIAGYPLIELVARRAARSGHDVVVATSEEDYDELIATALRESGVPVHRGSLDDVLGRFVAACADLDDDDLVVRLTGDNPLVDSDLIDDLVAATAASGFRYGRIDIDAVPEGLGAEVFSVRDLRRAGEQATDAYDREHVTPWLRRELGEHLHVPEGTPADIHAYRATVDSLHDFVRVSRVFRTATDPIRVEWRELIRSLSEIAPSGAARAPRKNPGLRAPGSVFLDAAAFQPGGASPAERARAGAQLRRLLADGVDLGVTEVFLDASDDTTSAAIRSAAFPALADRLAFLIRLTTDGETSGRHARVRGDVERTFAVLGQRRARGLLAPHPQIDRRTWQVVVDYVDEGVVELAGCSVSDPSELAAALTLPSLGLVEIDARGTIWTDPLEDELADLSHHGVHISVRLGVDTLEQAPQVLARRWSDSVVVPVGTPLVLPEVLASLQKGFSQTE